MRDDDLPEYRDTVAPLIRDYFLSGAAREDMEYVMNSQVEQVNALLLQGEPNNISVDEHSGYTGYKPQAVVDAMNEVLFGSWGFEEVSSEIEPGDKGGLAVAQVRVWLKDVEFKPVAWGQNRVTRGDIGDARKGAQTDAIKKALSYFSIGARAYHGLLDKKAPETRKLAQVSNHPTSSTQATSRPHHAVTMPMWTAERKEVIDRLYLKAKEHAGVVDGAGFISYLTLVLERNVTTVKTLSDDEISRINLDLASRAA